MKGRNTVVSFVALIIILYFVGVPILVMMLTSIFGSVNDVVSVLVGLIPFGEGLANWAIHLVNNIFGLATSYPETQGYLSISYILCELSKSVFVIVIYKVLNILGFAILALSAKGRWNAMKKIALSVFNALLAACFAPMVINLAINQIQMAASNGTSVGSIVATIVSHILFIVVTGGAMAIFIVVLGYTVGQAILKVLVQNVLIDLFRLLLSYLCILIALMAIGSGMHSMLYGGVVMLIMIAVIFALIDYALDCLLPVD
jgi:hypothetical protein